MSQLLSYFGAAVARPPEYEDLLAILADKNKEVEALQVRGSAGVWR
jgi:hypothetical protein